MIIYRSYLDKILFSPTLLYLQLTNTLLPFYGAVSTKKELPVLEYTI